jgi:protein-L-isoaspartate(D-aspartate) O-methyltransferase
LVIPEGWGLRARAIIRSKLMFDFAFARDRMVERQIAGRGITDPCVLAAMRATPREAFVASAFAKSAYDDAPLPIGEGQTISQPYIVARMIAAAALKPRDRVLEIGAGSGYAAAVMSCIAARVFAIERVPALGEAARRRFADLGYRNIELRIGDGTLGWPEEAPFNAIVVSAGGPDIPVALRKQLAIGGRLIIPVGSGAEQMLVKVVRQDAGMFTQEDLCSVLFVPLIGAQGWTDRDGAR